ncbi:MAG: glycerol-3-phosphate dehydrogenase/oxidase [Spirochaetales bacterium]|nr:glycerol-3-phosphate dehydrogenase/oxidase [Spirochaetales bacterium]
MKEWKTLDRESRIKAANGKEFDIVIIGGGITGAGIAREAALRNLSFCIIEKEDFAFGTSSRSSKLFHGGMRYLGQGEFGLVRESTTERNWLAYSIPNLVRPLGFLYSSYENSKDSPFMVKFGITFYTILSDWFSKYKTFRKSRVMKPKQVEEWEPELAQEVDGIGKIKMSGFYYDTNCDDSRVTLETIKDSLILQKNSEAFSYCKVNKVEGDAVKTVYFEDAISKETFSVKSKAVVSATGIWTDHLLKTIGAESDRIFPTKGVHLVVDNEQLKNHAALGIRHLTDGRFFFILKRNNLSIIGTTDTKYPKDEPTLDYPYCTKEDADYLLSTINKMFPHAKITYKDIIGTWAGVRPLIKPANAKSESDVSRTHEIFEEKGVVSIAGGKSTTHRYMAEELIHYLEKTGRIAKQDKKLMKKGFSKQPYLFSCTRKDFDTMVNKNNLDMVGSPEQQEYLWQQYGKGGVEILSTIAANPALGEEIVAGKPYSLAEFEYIAKYEQPVHLKDMLVRRTEAQWRVHWSNQKQLAEAVAPVVAKANNWTKDQTAAEIKDYLQYVYDSVAFIPGAEALTK